MQSNLFVKFRQAHGKNPGKPVLIDQKTSEAWDWQRIEELSARFANALAAQGVRQGDTVIVALAKSVHAAILYLACLRIGAVYAPLELATASQQVTALQDQIANIAEDIVKAGDDPSIPGAGLRARLKKMKFGALIVDPSLIAPMGEIKSSYPIPKALSLDSDGKGTLVDLAAKQNSAHQAATVQPLDPVVLLYTSGSTGKPKGAIHTARMLALNAADLAGQWGITANDRIYHAIPLTHIHGLYIAFNTVLLSGGSAVLTRGKFEPAEAMKWFADKNANITLFMNVPRNYQAWVNYLKENFLPEESRKFFSGTKLRLCIAGSDKVGGDLYDQFRNYAGFPLLIRYGMTEVMICIVQAEGKSNRDSIGTPLRRYKTRVIDPETGKENGTGALHMAGECVTPGYLNRPQVNAESFAFTGTWPFRTRWFNTGDIVERLATGELKYIGRNSSFFKVNGLRVDPEEMRHKISSHAACGQNTKQLVIFDISEDRLLEADKGRAGQSVGCYPVACVVLPPDLAAEARNKAIETVAAEILQAGCALENHMRPRFVYFPDILPTTAVGKLATAELRKNFLEQFKDQARTREIKYPSSRAAV